MPSKFNRREFMGAVAASGLTERQPALESGSISRSQAPNTFLIFPPILLKRPACEGSTSTCSSRSETSTSNGTRRCCQGRNFEPLIDAIEPWRRRGRASIEYAARGGI